MVLRLRQMAPLPAIESWAQLETFLRHQGLGSTDCEVALQVWRGYQAWFRDQ